jgi:hypothetical protein
MDRNRNTTHPCVRAGGGDSQVPWGVKALDGRVSHPAWRGKPTWYLVAKDDRMIPPDAQHFVSKRANATVVESKGSQSPVEQLPTIHPSIRHRIRAHCRCGCVRRMRSRRVQSPSVPEMGNGRHVSSRIVEVTSRHFASRGTEAVSNRVESIGPRGQSC